MRPVLQAIRGEMELVTRQRNVLTRAEPEVEIVQQGNYLIISTLAIRNGACGALLLARPAGGSRSLRSLRWLASLASESTI